MKSPILAIVCLAAIAAPFSARSQTPAAKPDYAASPVPFKDVQITDAFWTPRLENNRNVSIPKLLDGYGRTPDLRLLEAACYLLIQKPDPALKARIDSTLDAEIERLRTRKGKWTTEGDGDTLWAGNFLETAVAYYEATGSRKLLDVAVELADDLDAQFGPGKRHDISNHEGIKIGLVRLYRNTGNDKYLKLAKFFLDTRGNPAGRPGGLYGPYAQDHQLIKTQSRGIGHSVRATYLYMSLTDIAALTGDSGYARANERIWEDAMSKRTYLTGGIGSYRDEEDYGDDYDLPNLSCWNEICAAYGNVLWDQRLFQQKQESKYVDALERTLYNAFLVGVSLKGDTYLYQAPLRTLNGFTRSEWFGPNCCPPNVARLFPQLGSLIYAQNGNALFVNLFVGSKAATKLKDTPINITQETEYPWDGAVKLTISPQKAQKFPLMVRIPGWARSQPIPGQLYRYQYLPAREQEIALTINGTKSTYSLDRGYARIEREWKPGDIVQFTLQMPVRRALSSQFVEDNRGMVALERGPLVYCLERADNPGGIFNLVMPEQGDYQFAMRKDLLGGIGAISGKATALSRERDRGSVVKQDTTFTAIPYYASANRPQTEMTVWLAREESKAIIAPTATIASTSKATSSVGNGTVKENYPGNNPPTTQRRMYPLSQDGSGDISAIYDQVEPVNSEDGSSVFLRLRPQSGDNAWVQYDFAKPEKVSSVEVYWKDDKQFCVLPKGWQLQYRDGNTWRPVATTSTYPVVKDRFNKVSFQPVTTSALRIELQLQPKVYKKGQLGPPDANYMDADMTWYEGGIIEWRVNP